MTSSWAVMLTNPLYTEAIYTAFLSVLTLRIGPIYGVEVLNALISEG